MPWILKSLHPEKGNPEDVSERIIHRLKMTEQ